jgi:hypothetical protein
VIRESKRFPVFKICPAAKEAFERFVQGIVKEGTRVAFFIPPLHPTVYELAGRNSRGEPVENYETYLENLKAVEAGVRSIADASGCSVLGSFVPEASHCEKQDFYDWIHPNPNGTSKILAQNPLSWGRGLG